jgi:hypothetical protein
MEAASIPETPTGAPQRNSALQSLSAWTTELRGGAPVGVSGIDAASMGDLASRRL